MGLEKDKNIFKKNGLNLLLTFASVILSLYLLDSLLYFAAPYLPWNLARMLSMTACVRFERVNADLIPWVYEKNIRYCKPDPKIYSPTDRLGYRNPRGYLESCGKRMDVLLLGDSFVWGTEDKTIAQYIVESLPGINVYSLGMGGEGIPQWRSHFERFVSLTGMRPRLVVFNFYAGNDVFDTKFFLGLEKKYGTVDASIYFQGDAYRSRTETFYRLPEIISLARNLLQKSQIIKPIRITGLTGPCDINLQEREPRPGEIDDAVLNEIKKNTDMVRRLSPDTHILLSYLPCATDLYGDRIAQCPECAADMAHQKANSECLRNYATELNIDYFDCVQELRAHAENKMLWVGAHFNQEGYRLYSELLAEKIKALLP
jgi:hypothetical protein